MRDTLLLIAFLAIIAVGFSASKRWQNEQSGTTAASNDSASKFINGNHGRNYENSSRKHVGKIENSRPSEGSEGDDSEGEELPSIYSRQHKKSASAAVIAPKRGRKRSVIGGMPTDAYVRSRKTSLSLAQVTPDEGNGLRVFLQCMEIKQGNFEYTGQRQCKNLMGGINQR